MVYGNIERVVERERAIKMAYGYLMDGDLSVCGKNGFLVTIISSETLYRLTDIVHVNVIARVSRVPLFGLSWGRPITLFVIEEPLVTNDMQRIIDDAYYLSLLEECPRPHGGMQLIATTLTDEDPVIFLHEEKPLVLTENGKRHIIKINLSKKEYYLVAMQVNEVFKREGDGLTEFVAKTTNREITWRTIKIDVMEDEETVQKTFNIMM